MPEIENIAVVDNYGKPPKPSNKQPFSQVEWIFEKRKSRAYNDSTKSNFQAAKRFFIQHIQAIEGLKPYYLADKWDEFALLRFKEELQDRIDVGELSLSSYTLTGHFSAVKQVMSEAAAYGLLNSRVIQNTSWGVAKSETDAHECYSDGELNQILSAVATELKFSYTVANGYVNQTEGGKDPRISPTRGRDKGFGFGVEKNMRWYFENVLKCVPIFRLATAIEKHKRFIDAANIYHGGLHKLYRSWGITALIDVNLIMPLAINLQYLTGLNPSSLLILKVDCFQEEHPLTGMPYLRYEKQRSQGEKELHLPLLEKREERNLNRKQTHQVQRAVETVLKLTAKIRERLPESDPLKCTLFIHSSTGQRTYNKTLPLTDKRTSAWCKWMVQKYDLRNDQGLPLNFNLVRFRSTKLTEMALEGRDFYEIQQVARHKSVTQTVRYIAENRLDGPARKTVSEALERIRNNHAEVVLATTLSADVAPKPIHLFKGLIADCKNVFDPPEQIKRTIDYVPGQVCTRFNMCLFCRNVVVLKEHLPSLVAYRAQILASKENNVQNLPHGPFYDQTLSVLDNLFSPESSQFTFEDIEWAFEIATTIDVVVDPVLYRGVCK